MKTDKEFLADYAGRTKKARKEAGYTQETMADALGTDRGNYKQYEKRTKLPQKFVARFCELTGVTTQWLMDGTSMPGDLTPQQRRWLNLIDRQPTKRLKALEMMLREQQNMPDNSGS